MRSGLTVNHKTATGLSIPLRTMRPGNPAPLQRGFFFFGGIWRADIAGLPHHSTIAQSAGRCEATPKTIGSPHGQRGSIQFFERGSYPRSPFRFFIKELLSVRIQKTIRPLEAGFNSGPPRIPVVAAHFLLIVLRCGHQLVEFVSTRNQRRHWRHVSKTLGNHSLSVRGDVRVYQSETLANTLRANGISPLTGSKRAPMFLILHWPSAAFVQWYSGSNNGAAMVLSWARNPGRANSQLSGELRVPRGCDRPGVTCCTVE